MRGVRQVGKSEPETVIFVPATVRIWLVLAALTTVICLFVNLAVQQNFRTTADDPQVQLAQDAARMLGENRSVRNSRTQIVDVGRSLAPWVAVYDGSGRAIESSGQLNGAAPQLPDGVFAAARSRGENRVTWQPATGIRIATVVEFVGTPNVRYVVSGRSLREVEGRVENLNRITLAAWAVTLLLCAVLARQIRSAGTAASQRSL